MRINRDNYESFLVDYTDGALSAEKMQEVDDFLCQNPDVKREFELFNSDAIELEDIFIDKTNLKSIPFEKTDAKSDTFQQLCVNYIDNLQSDSEKQFFNELVINDTEKVEELNQYLKTKLPIESALFNEKLLVKKGTYQHNITDDNFEEYCVASVDGWLDFEGLTKLNKFIADNPSKKAELDLFYKTKISPDLSIIYPDKLKIKRFKLLTTRVKKYLAVVSSVAAILVFSLLVFNTSTVDNQKLLGTNVSAISDTNKQQKVIAEESVSIKSKVEDTEVEKEPILNDPFGLKKIAVSEEQIAVNKLVRKRELVRSISPIMVEKIKCSICNGVDDYKELAKNSTIKNIDIVKNSNRNNTTEELIKNKFNTIKTNGITGIDKITNGRLKVKKNKAGDKTLIAFNSKYFSISTNVKSRNRTN